MTAARILGTYVKDTVTGIVGRVIATIEYEHDAPQIKIQRYGVDTSGKPIEAAWAYCANCVPSSAEEARK